MKIRLQVNKGLDGKFRKMENAIEGYYQFYLQGMANQLILFSPVDTGTYITNHNLGTGSSGGSISSKGKPRNQPWSTFADQGLGRLAADISAMASQPASVTFSNSAEHAFEVEYDHGYAPYTKTAREHGNIAARAAAQAEAML